MKCDRCGSCCKCVPDNILIRFHLPRAESGGCGHLTKDNLCGIWKTRPIVCRSSDMDEFLCAYLGVNGEELDMMRVQACYMMKRARSIFGLGTKALDNDCEFM